MEHRSPHTDASLGLMGRDREPGRSMGGAHNSHGLSCDPVSRPAPGSPPREGFACYFSVKEEPTDRSRPLPFCPEGGRCPICAGRGRASGGSGREPGDAAGPRRAAPHRAHAPASLAVLLGGTMAVQVVLAFVPTCACWLRGILRLPKRVALNVKLNDPISVGQPGNSAAAEGKGAPWALLADRRDALLRRWVSRLSCSPSRSG